MTSSSRSNRCRNGDWKIEWENLHDRMSGGPRLGHDSQGAEIGFYRIMRQEFWKYETFRKYTMWLQNNVEQS